MRSPGFSTSPMTFSAYPPLQGTQGFSAPPQTLTPTEDNCYFIWIITYRSSTLEKALQVRATREESRPPSRMEGSRALGSVC